ncbi:MAG: asparaginase [Halanaerobiales bacterium]
MTKKVYVAYTGGTIGMLPSPDGYELKPGYLKEQVETIINIRKEDVPEVDIQEYEPLIDSANMTPDHWVELAEDIASKYHEYDGFVVLHGTDTMSYTASALAFMLQGLNKPVIFTGSQIPISQVRNDAWDNLITAILITANYKIPEVCLYFGDQLLRGCRSVKTRADQLDAFASPNYPPLAQVGVDIRVKWPNILSEPDKEFQLIKFKDYSIGTIKFFPGISADIVKNILQPPLKGLVIEAYGLGNGPDQNQKLVNVFKKANDRGVILVACTQSLQGKVNLKTYTAGSVFSEAGFIGGADMTIEAALTKLYYLLSMGYSSSEIKEKIKTNLCGELTAR